MKTREKRTKRTKRKKDIQVDKVTQKVVPKLTRRIKFVECTRVQQPILRLQYLLFHAVVYTTNIYQRKNLKKCKN